MQSQQDARSELFTSQNRETIKSDGNCDNLHAHRAAVEAVSSGRAALSTIAQQGQQLANAEEISDSNAFMLDKSNRILKGMTWSGWVSNMFTSNVEASGPSDTAVRLRKTAASTAPPRSNSNNSHSNPNLPKHNLTTSHPAAAASTTCVNDYKMNVTMLASSATSSPEDFDLLESVCDELKYRAISAMSTLERLSSSLNDDRLFREFTELSMEFERIQNVSDRVRRPGSSSSSTNNNKNLRDELLSTSTSTSTITSNSTLTSNSTAQQQQQLQKQDAHLENLAPQLDELKALSLTLNGALSDHNEALDKLDYKTENLTEKTKLVVRRAGRLNQKGWYSEKQKFDSWITIQECSTLRYLTIKGDQLVLSDCLKRDANNFCLWTRQGNSNGIQSGLSDNFIGQSFLGNLVCSNSKFGRNEEVEFSDVNLDQTRIVISSAGWGKGDYIKWSEKKDGKGKLGFCGGHDKKATATIWKITKIAGPETAVEKNRELI